MLHTVNAQVCEGRPRMGQQQQRRQQAGRAGLPRGGPDAEAEEEDGAAEAAQQRARPAPAQPAGGGARAAKTWACTACEGRSISARQGWRQKASFEGQACRAKETLISWSYNGSCRLGIRVYGGGPCRRAYT